jgi:ABC-type nitrate/sulfonate/bicarbonate transport system substrate-binding protein
VYAPPTADAAGLYIAQQENLFKDAGLTVTIKQASSDQRVINDQALHPDQIDITVGNYVSYIEAQENYTYKGMLPLTYKAGGPTGNAADIPMFLLSSDLYIVAEASILSPGYAGLFVPAGSPVNTVAGLKGRTIGINAQYNAAYVLISTFLAENGMTPSQVHFASYSFPRMQAALMNHEIQVAFLAEPYASKAEAAGLTKLTDLVDANTQDFPLAGYAVTKQWARHNPDTLQAFLHALETGQQIADTNRQATEAALAAEVPGLTSEEAGLLSLETYPVGKPDLNRLERVINSAERFGVVSGDIFDARLLLPDGS